MSRDVFHPVTIGAGAVRMAQDLGDGWTADYDVRADGAIRRVVVEPIPGTTRPLTARMLRALSTGPVVEAARAHARDVWQHAPQLRDLGHDVGDWLGPDWTAALAAIAEGRAGASPVERRRLTILETAARYEAATARGEQSARTAVARELDVDESVIRDRLHAARRAGLMEPADGPGRRGGRLTPKGRQELQELLEGRER